MDGVNLTTLISTWFYLFPKLCADFFTTSVAGNDWFFSLRNNYAHYFPVLHRAPCNDQLHCHLASVQEILPYPEGFTYCLIKTWVGQRADDVFGGCRVTAPGLDPVWTSRMTSQEEEDVVDKKRLYRRSALKIAYG